MKRKKKKNDWFVFQEVPGIYWFHSCYNFGIAFELKKRSGFGLSKYAADFQEGVQRLYALRSEWQAGGQWYLNAIFKNPKKLVRDIAKVKAAADILYYLNKKLLKVNPKRCTLGKLGLWYNRFHKAQHELWCSGMVINYLEFNQSFLFIGKI